MRILLLTNNLFYEQSMQDKLQILNYETFCSESFSKADYLQELVHVSQHFDVLIFSETISELSIERGLERLKETGIPVIRKHSSETNTDETDISKEKESKSYTLNNDCSLEKLREILSQFEHRTQQNLDTNKTFSQSKEKIDLIDLHLSSKEYQVISFLYEAGKNVVSREAIAKHIWKDGANNSNLAQISSIIKRIKLKTLNRGIPSKIIRTLWGRGYLLEEDALEYIIFPEKYQDEKALAKKII